MTKELEDLCTIKQACFSEKAGRTTVNKRIKEGHYKAFKIGGSIFGSCHRHGILRFARHDFSFGR